MGAFLALASSALWGTGDFLGGSLSRRAHPLLVMRATQFIAFVGMLVVAVVSGEIGDTLGYLPFGLGAGVAGVIGLSCFYGALAAGTMGVVAPIASLGVAVPVAVGLARGESPSGVQIAGIVVAVIGAVLVSGPERSVELDRIGRAERRRPLVLAAVAAVGFGGALTLMAEGSARSTVMTLTTMRITNVVLATAAVVVLVRRSARAPVQPGRRDLGALVAIAFFDTSANACYGIATTTTLLSLAAVLGSLYPAMTALLAWRFHGEQLTRTQLGGVALVLAGVAAIAGGG